MILLSIAVVLIVLSFPYSYFQPKFELVLLDNKHFRLNVWYNKWEGQKCIRKQKTLIRYE